VTTAEGSAARLTAAQKKEIVTLYRAGATIRDVAAALGIPRSTVATILHEQGVPARPAARPRKLAEAQEKALTDAYRAGATVPALAARYGIGETLVRWVVRRRGARKHREPSRRARMTDALSRQVVERYGAGENARAIAAALGVSKTAVYGVLHREGVPVRPTGRTPTLSAGQDAELAARYEAGETEQQLAAVIGVSRGVVARALDRRQVPKRPRGPSPREGFTAPPAVVKGNRDVLHGAYLVTPALTSP